MIAFSPVVETGFEPVLQEAKKAGIPVVLSDRAVKVSDPSLYVTFLGSDFVEEGRRAAKAVVKLTGGKANIAELVGTVGSAPAIDRKKGFEEVLTKYPGHENHHVAKRRLHPGERQRGDGSVFEITERQRD